MDFLDVRGASGAAYRFRRADPDHLPATAGNLVAVSGASPRLDFLLCATTSNLSSAARPAGEAVRDKRGAQLFIRLNVARAVRQAEHADIVAAVQPAQALAELD